MATPSRTTTTSTPKPTSLTPTSVRKMASPRPVTAGKSLAYKSPMAAMKTPASAHSHNISTSSQPSNTPLLAHTFTEGAVNLDSPSAALMGFSNSHGLTPLPSGLDGLGLQSNSARQAAEAIARNPEADKIHRLQDIASSLKTRVAGRGVTRDGVVRVAQLNGFTTYWDEDLLTVAGNCVDLEIMFDDARKDTVKDVVLKISASGSDKRQEEGSEILKRDLAQSPGGTSQEPWNMLNRFADNIARLRQLDKLSENGNCFEAVDGLYEAFKQIWEEEKKRLKWRSELHHVCESSVGRVQMNKRRKLGVAVEYWAPQYELVTDANSSEGNGETSSEVAMNEEDHRCPDCCWTAQISCEAGFQTLRVSRDWLSSDVLTPDDSLEEAQTQESRPLRPAWKVHELQDGETSVTKEDTDPTKVDGGDAHGLATTNAHFTFTLDPVLYLPLSIVDSLVGQGLMLTTDRSKVTTYRQVLGTKDAHRWLESLDIYDAEGNKRTCQHSYTISALDLECYPIDIVGFAHPSQLSSLMPTFRQYACLWSMLRKLVSSPTLVGEIAQPETLYKPGQKIKPCAVQKRSNLKSPMPRKEATAGKINALKIDVTLSFTETSPLMKPKLEVYTPLISGHGGEPMQQWFCYAAFEIEENGKLKTLSSQIPSMDRESARRSTDRVLTLTEDIGALVEWMLEQAGSRR